MAYYEDLSPYEYCGKDGSINIGWLEQGREFRTGEVNPIIVRNLHDIKRSMVSFRRMRGYHKCDLCGKQHGVVDGNGEIRVVGGDGTVYASPALITHYIIEHGYMPPDCFLDAVMNYNLSPC